MDVLDDIGVELSVVLGSAQLPIRQILRMGRGATIPLDTGNDDPTKIYVNGRLVATGRVLVADDHMSLEVTEVMRRSTR